MNNPYFTIIIPVYKVEDYLVQCVDSILCQNMNDYEIILVDDGSPDHSPEICDAFSKSYDFIRTVHQRNGGLSSARNKGLSMAKGEYILFVDSDDFWCCDDALLSIKIKLDKSNADVLVFGKKKYYQLAGNYSKEILPVSIMTDYSREEIIRYMMEHNAFVASAWDKVIRRTFIVENKMEFVLGQVSEDIEWCAKILLGNPKMTTLAKCIYVYRQQNNESITANIGRKNIECVANVILKYTENTDNKNLLNYFAEQYVLWLTISNFVKKNTIQDLLFLMKRRWDLMNYNWYPHVRKISKFKILGFELVRKLLGFYKKGKRKR